MPPYLTFVFCVSHLQYGGDFSRRIYDCLSNLYVRCQQYGLDAEVVVAELEGAGARQFLSLPHDYCPTKIVTVPKSVHDGLPNPHKESYFEYVMKNVGIRRASGTFILSSNPDNIYSPELIARLARRDLDPSCFYRVDRSDVRDGKVFQVNKNTGTVPGPVSELANKDPNGLHFNASGDFILMSHDAWHKIKGHPEVPYSLTVDGQTVHLASQIGLKQVILPEPMYHADHSRSPKWAPFWSDNAPWAIQNENDSWGLRDFALNSTTI